MSVSIRRARLDDVDWLHGLTSHEDVDPFLAASRDRSREALVADVDRSEREPERFGRFVIEFEGELAGTVTFERVNTHSAIAELRNLALHPTFRGRGVGIAASRLLHEHLLRELGFHRLQLEVYGFNERAQVHAERSGFRREGVRRNAYRHAHGWTDGVLFGMTAEDFEEDRSWPETRPPEGGSTSSDPPGTTS